MPPEDPSHDALAMKRYFDAAGNWDRLRRRRLRGTPNDPVANRKAYNALMERLGAIHSSLPQDSPEDDAAEVRLAQALSGRRPD